jgi:EAL domain-containing protein (putative c-di-GMP-specific phosphodiesterase class I)
VKIDGSLVEQLAIPEVLAIVRAIVDLAHGLHLWVVAEAVETARQEAILIELGCDCAQGYRFGPAV